MRNFNLQHWWNLIAAAGAVIAVAFFIAQLTHGFLLGMGLVLLGVGERINHPARSDFVRGEDSHSSITTESDPREPNLSGLALDILGIGSIGIALLLMVFAP
jgi:hypothetical protein